MGGSWDDVRRFWRKLDPTDRRPPTPPPLPEGRIVNVPGRGEMLVREVPGVPGQPNGRHQHDHLIRPRRQHELAAAIPGARVVGIDAAHNAWMVQSEEVAEALADAVGWIAGRVGGRRGPGAPPVPVSS